MKLKILKLQSGMDIRIKICAWHWLLLTLETTVIKLQGSFHQTTSVFIGFLKGHLSEILGVCLVRLYNNMTRVPRFSDT